MANGPHRPILRCGAAVLAGPARLSFWTILFLGGLGRVAAATPEAPLVLIQSAPGRFEVASVDASVAHGVAAEAEEAWFFLRGPLRLPEAFTSPVYVRATPDAPDIARDAAPFRVTVEIGGRVLVQLRESRSAEKVVRHALVQGLLMRLAVAAYGVDARLTSPLWLEHACVGWWQTRAEAAQLDALKLEAARHAPPTVESLLLWPHGGTEPRAATAAAVWLLGFLQSESGTAEEWPAFLTRLLAGHDPLIALVESYPGRFSSAEQRELWWRTGYHHLRRVRTLPSLDARDSQAQLAALARFVYAGSREDADTVVPLRVVMSRAREPVVAADLARRGLNLAKLAPTFHPFYRNAGVSLGEVFAAVAVAPQKLDALCAGFERDWQDAMQMETATTAALERLEAKSPPP